MEPREVGRRMVILSLLRRKKIDSRTADCVLYRGQLLLLESVIQNPSITQQELASRLGVTPASVAQSVKRLERAGLVEKHIDPKNLRRNQLTATESGVTAASRYRSLFDEIDKEIFAGFSDAELQAFSGCLDRMIENIMCDDFDLTKFPFRKDNKA